MRNSASSWQPPASLSGMCHLLLAPSRAQSARGLALSAQVPLGSRFFLSRCLHCPCRPAGISAGSTSFGRSVPINGGFFRAVSFLRGWLMCELKMPWGNWSCVRLELSEWNWTWRGGGFVRGMPVDWVKPEWNVILRMGLIIISCAGWNNMSCVGWKVDD